MNILIVDDDKNRITTLSSFITNGKELYNISTADSLNAARQLLQKTYYDILILDVFIPRRLGDSPDPNHGLAVLEMITTKSRYKKPERIIGITAHISDIENLREKFNKYCFVIIEAHQQSIGWKSKILDAIDYTRSSKIVRSIIDNNIHVITIHGIRTFGGWQKRFHRIINDKWGEIPFHAYKYGIFSVFAFFIPIIRYREVNRLRTHLLTIAKENKESKFVIFSHSFGTFLAVKSIQKLIQENRVHNIELLVLSGSVLPQSFNWGIIREKGIKVVNDCADNDYVLYLSQGFVWGTGMAGKCGFYGFNDHMMVNRFFLGGHSSYFDDNNFMEEYWAPLLDSKVLPRDLDMRNQSIIRHHILDKIFIFLGWLKYFFYVLFFVYLLFKALPTFQPAAGRSSVWSMGTKSARPRRRAL